MFTCRTCGKQFERKGACGPNPTSCSVECRLIYSRAKLKAARADQPPPEWKQPRQCLHCGQTYTPWMRKQEYCSVDCRRTSKTKLGMTVTRECAACGKTFTIEPKRGNTANCAECRKQRPQWHLTTTIACLQCGKRFHPRHDSKGFCSKSCGRIAQAAEYRRKHPKQLAMPLGHTARFPCQCRVCGKSFLGKTPKTTLCSDTCARVYRHQRCFLRRSIYNAPEADAIDFAVVCERDHWTCGICGEPVDPALKWPNPKAASLDHITPIAAGGKHTYSNVQLAHLICNWSKGKPRAKKPKAPTKTPHASSAARSSRRPSEAG